MSPFVGAGFGLGQWGKRGQGRGFGSVGLQPAGQSWRGGGGKVQRSGM